MVRNAAQPSRSPRRGTALRALLQEELGDRLDDLRRFVDRRLAEVSVEIHGAVQMVDFTESNLSGQIAEVRAQIAGLVAAPVAATHNSGLELEAVVAATEAAAERIMDAAEAINGLIAEDRRDPADRAALAAGVNAIFEACAFQDLTGQRIGRAIAQLRAIETLLERMMSGTPAPPAAPGVPAADSSADLGQDEVDRLLG